MPFSVGAGVASIAASATSRTLIIFFLPLLAGNGAGAGASASAAAYELVSTGEGAMRTRRRCLLDGAGALSADFIADGALGWYPNGCSG